MRLLRWRAEMPSTSFPAASMATTMRQRFMPGSSRFFAMRKERMFSVHPDGSFARTARQCRCLRSAQRRAYSPLRWIPTRYPAVRPGTHVRTGPAVRPGSHPEPCLAVRPGRHLEPRRFRMVSSLSFRMSAESAWDIPTIRFPLSTRELPVLRQKRLSAGVK